MHLLSTFVARISILCKGRGVVRAKPADRPHFYDQHNEMEKAVSYEHFLKEFDLEERRYFYRLACRCVRDKNYSKGETLYLYCYFSTLKHRMEQIRRLRKPLSGVGAYVYTQGIKELEYAVDYYRRILEQGSFTPCIRPSVSYWMEERMRELSKPLKSLGV